MSAVVFLAFGEISTWHFGFLQATGVRTLGQRPGVQVIVDGCSLATLLPGMQAAVVQILVKPIKVGVPVCIYSFAGTLRRHYGSVHTARQKKRYQCIFQGFHFYNSSRQGNAPEVWLEPGNCLIQRVAAATLSTCVMGLTKAQRFDCTDLVPCWFASIPPVYSREFHVTECFDLSHGGDGVNLPIRKSINARTRVLR